MTDPDPVAQSVSPCFELCRDLKAAIDRRMLGRQANSFSHGGRSVGYDSVPIEKLIAYYRQQRSQCPEALATLPDVDLAMVHGPRPPMRLRRGR